MNAPPLTPSKAPHILAIDAQHDDTVSISFNYRNQHVYPALEQLGFTIIRCQGSMARRKYVTQAMQRNDIIYMTGTGHGNDNTYTGDWNTPIFSTGNYNPKEIANKVVHFLSCNVAAILGSDFVNHGCLAFFGYDANFVFERQYADVFFQCDSEIDIALAEECTAEEAYNRAVALYNANIAEMESIGRFTTAIRLEHNRDHLCAPSVDSRWGDRKTKIV